MRVAVVHSFYSSDSPSGENSVVEDQVAELQRAGIETKLFARYTDLDSRLPLYRAKSALRSSGFYPSPSPLEELDQFQPDIVHIHNLFPNWSTRWLGQIHFPSIVTLHNFRPVCAAGTLWRAGGPCTKCLEASSAFSVIHSCYRDSHFATIPLAVANRRRGGHNPVLQKSASIVTLNPKAFSIYRSLLPAATRVNYIPNFAPDITIKPAVDTSVAKRFWLYGGRITSEKGAIWLAKVWNAQLPPLKIAGIGPSVNELKQMIRGSSNIEFLGQLDREAFLNRLASADGLVLPSFWPEGLPTVALEALSLGIPNVVASACSAAASLTAQGSGEVFEHDEDGSDLGDAVMRVSARHGDYSSNARSLYESRFSPSSWREAIINEYQALIALNSTAKGV